MRADVDANGVLNLQQLAPAPDPAPQAPAPRAETWRVTLASVRLADIALRYRDFTRLTPLELGVGALELGLSARVETGAGDPRVTLDDVALQLSRVTLGPAAAGEPLVNLDTIGLEGGRLELHRKAFPRAASR